MATDAIGGIGKPAIPTPAPTKSSAAAVAPEQKAAASEGDNWISQVGGVISDVAEAVVPSLSKVAEVAALATPVGGIMAAVEWAKNLWVKVSGQKTQAFLDANLAKFSTAGQDALRQLNARGVLDAVDPKWHSLRDNLDAFLRAGGSPQIAEAVLAQIANPSSVKQVRQFTCVAATSQLAIVSNNPAQYFQIATDLLTKGVAELPNGQRLTVTAENKAWIDQQGYDMGGRLNALFQAALMDYASEGGYQMATDQVIEGEGKLRHLEQGLEIDRAQRLNEAILQVPIIDVADLVSRLEAAKNACLFPAAAAQEALETAWKALGAVGRGGLLVPITTTDDLGDMPSALRNANEAVALQDQPAHMVMVRSIKDGKVTWMDAMGNERVEDVAAFAQRICADAETLIGGDTRPSSTGSGTRRGR